MSTYPNWGNHSSTLHLEFAMEQRTPLPTNNVKSIRKRWEETMGCVADVVKDALLDWGGLECELPENEHFETLPPLTADCFVSAMHGPTIELLCGVAEVLNNEETGYS